MSFINALVGGGTQQISDNEESINDNQLKIYELRLMLFGKMSITNNLKIYYSGSKFADLNLASKLYNLKELIDEIRFRAPIYLSNSNILGSSATYTTSFDGLTLTIVCQSTSTVDSIYIDLPPQIHKILIYLGGTSNSTRMTFIKSGSTYTGTLTIDPVPQSFIDKSYLTTLRLINGINTPVRDVSFTIGVVNLLPV